MSETNSEPESPEPTITRRGRPASKPEKRSVKQHYARELLDLRNRVLTALDLLDEALKNGVSPEVALSLVRVAARRLRGE